MSLIRKTQLASAVAILAASLAFGQEPAPSFAPFEQWKAAVLSGDAVALKSFYSTDPPAQIQVNMVNSGADTDIGFWLVLKPRSMKTSVVRNEPRHGHISYIFRAEVVPDQPNAPTIWVTDDQSWQQQGNEWRLITVERTDSPKLKQPSDMKKDIYPANADAHAEIKEAEEKAANAHKRLLLVFGANWCFDCHVLDLAFQRSDIAPILVANYEVVHVDLGPEEEKNSDLVKKYEIPLNKGIPALAVAESDGKLVASQKNGEFEDARRLAPEFLVAFLNKWKPR
ncbi:MAG TPA: thioredoxin family protein [Candidatus Sulfotelmatobacter sp.]|nr:thioredoxin family protein [Candidatus Sulfotelmatobacter sp.]